MTEPKKRNPRFLISGAGLIGLLVAQALKAREIDFTILDRDKDVQFRESAGWAITLHWALETFKDLLPENLRKEIYEAEVRPNFHEADTGSFKYINAATGETIVSIPPSKRLRVRREQIRRMLLKGIEVQWDCKLEAIDTSDVDGVKVRCSNGKIFTGDILLGCEGANSMTRRLICKEDGNLNQLPIRFCGAKIKMNGAEAKRIAEKFDPLLFQGTIPSNGTFFWFSMLATPDYTKEEDVYYAQVNLSWKAAKDEPFDTHEAKAKAMKVHAIGLSYELSWMVDRAVEEPESLLEIKLCDWPKVEWDTKSNRVLLVGDSAHAMTMYRGEAANHGITDVHDLMVELDDFLSNKQTWEQAVDSYSKNINSRTAPAVLLSRQACVDAHDYSKIRVDSKSPLLAIRKKIL